MKCQLLPNNFRLNCELFENIYHTRYMQIISDDIIFDCIILFVVVVVQICHRIGAKK